MKKIKSFKYYDCKKVPFNYDIFHTLNDTYNAYMLNKCLELAYSLKRHSANKSCKILGRRASEWFFTQDQMTDSNILQYVSSSSYFPLIRNFTVPIILMPIIPANNMTPPLLAAFEFIDVVWYPPSTHPLNPPSTPTLLHASLLHVVWYPPSTHSLNPPSTPILFHASLLHVVNYPPSIHRMHHPSTPILLYASLLHASLLHVVWYPPSIHLLNHPSTPILLHASLLHVVWYPPSIHLLNHPSTPTLLHASRHRR